MGCEIIQKRMMDNLQLIWIRNTQKEKSAQTFMTISCASFPQTLNIDQATVARQL